MRGEDLSSAVLDALEYSVIITSPEGIITHWNSGAEELYGWKAQEVLGVSIFDVVPSEPFRGQAVSSMETILSGRSWSGEYTARRKDGSVFSAGITGNPVFGEDGRLEGVVHSSRDISSRNREKQKLQEEEKRRIAILESLGAGVLVQKKCGTITWANQAAVEIFGMDMESLLGSTSSSLDWQMTDEHGAPLAPGNHPSMITLGTGKPVKNAVRGLFRNDSDRAIWLQINTEPVFLEDSGSPEEVIISFSDITDLMDSRAQLDNLVKASNVGLWTWNPVDNTVTYSDQWKKQIGYEPHEIGNTFQEWESRVHPDDVERMRAFLQEQIETGKGSWNTEFRFRHRDGHYLWIFSSASVFFDASGNPVLTKGSHIDISRIREAEEKLEKANRSLEAAQELAGMGSWTYHTASNEVYWSSNLYRMLGIPPSEEPMSWEEHLSYTHPACGETAVREMEAAIGNCKIMESQFRLLKDNGESLWVNFKGEPVLDGSGRTIGFNGTVQDITGRKTAEEQLRKTTALFTAAMDCSPAGIMIVDAPEGNPRYVNRVARTISAGLISRMEEGEKFADLVNEGHLFHLNGEPLLLHEEPLFLAINEGKTTSLRLRLSPGGGVTNSYVWAHAAPIRDENGGITAAVLVFPDITNIVLAEKEKTALEQRLSHSMKMESVGRLAGGIAHDFNNLLTVILGSVSMAGMQLSNHELVKLTLGEIERAASRAAELTGQLLAFSRKQIIEPVVMDPAELLERSTEMIRRLIGEDLELTINLESTSSRVKVDPVQMEQVMINLAVNARDAMPEGGKLTISLFEKSLSGDFCRTHPETVPGNHVCVSVEDTGHGMDTITAQRIFEPFYTTRKDGTGMGLSTVYGIIMQHSGCIDVQSTPGEGTVFTICLPVTNDPLPVQPFSKEKENAPRGEETIMVVEDDTMVRGVAVRILSALGYRVLEADSGEIALKIMEEEGVPADLLFTDVVMPGMNGRELADRLTGTFPDLKVLFASGYSEQTIEHHGILEEGINYLQKPYTARVLSEKIRKVLDS